jgi:hypothetical protein
VPAWKCGCARTGQLTATRATRATRLIPTALGSPPGAANREGASQIAGLPVPCPRVARMLHAIMFALFKPCPRQDSNLRRAGRNPRVSIRSFVLAALEPLRASQLVIDPCSATATARLLAESCRKPTGSANGSTGRFGPVARIRNAL